MKENYTYPVILEPDGNFVNIRIPAFDAVSCVEAREDPIPAAQDLLTLEIIAREDEGEPLPDAEAITPDSPGQSVAYVNIWMPYHRSKVKETYVKKTLTIPVWLDLLAKQGKINFSATLTEALKEKLSLS